MAESGEIRAKRLLDLVYKSPNSEKTMKAVFREAQFVRNILADMLIDKNPDEYIDLIIEIFYSTEEIIKLVSILGLTKKLFEKQKKIWKAQFHKNYIDKIFELAYGERYGYLTIAYLKPLLFNQFINFDVFSIHVSKFYKNFKIDQRLDQAAIADFNERLDYYLAALCSLFSCEDFLNDIKIQTSNILKSSNFTDYLYPLVNYLRYLNLNNIKTYNKQAMDLAYKYITHKHRDIREGCIEILIAIDDNKRADILKTLRDDRSKYIREFVENELKDLNKKNNHIEFIRKFLWDELTMDFDVEKEEDIYFAIPKHLKNYFIKNKKQIRSQKQSKKEKFISNDIETKKQDFKNKPNKKTAAKQKPKKKTKIKGNQHTEIQGMLAKFGLIQGYDIHIASNDRTKKWPGGILGDYSIENLPYLVLPQKIMQQIGLIDILWLHDEKFIERAIEIEYSTSIYSGLLRLQDLALSVPNLRINISLAIPKKRLSKLKAELSRTSFEKLKRLGVSYCTFEDIADTYEKFKDTPKNTLVKNILPWKTL